MRFSRGIILILGLALPALVLLPVWQHVGLVPDGPVLRTFIPHLDWIATTLRAGDWPWLNPWNGLDRPLAASPTTAIWYPATYLALVLSPTRVYTITLGAHAALAIFGTYRLLRTMRVRRQAAFLGGIVFAFSGFMLAQQADPCTWQAAAWSPIVLWRLYRYLVNPGDSSAPDTTATELRNLALASIAAALQFLAGAPVIAILTLAAGLVLTSHSHPIAAQTTPVNHAAPVSATTAHRGRFGQWALVVVCTAGLTALQWLPALVFAQQTVWADPGYAAFTVRSFQPADALAWLYPHLLPEVGSDAGDGTYGLAYLGILPLLLACLGCGDCRWRTDARRKPWVVVALLALLLALGRYSPLYAILYWLPGGGFLRPPVAALSLFSLALAVLAALTWHDLAARLNPERARLRARILRWTRRPVRRALLLAAIPLLILLALLPLQDTASRAALLEQLDPRRPAVWIPILLLLLAHLGLRFTTQRWQRPRWLLLLTLLTVADLTAFGWLISFTRPTHDPSQRPTWQRHVTDPSARLWVADRPAHPATDPIQAALPNTNIPGRVAIFDTDSHRRPRRWIESLAHDADTLVEPLRQAGWRRRYHTDHVLLFSPDLPAPDETVLVATGPNWRLYRARTPSRPAFFDPAIATYTVDHISLGPNEFELAVRRTSTAPDTASQQPINLVVARWAWAGWQARIGEQALPIGSTPDGLLRILLPALTDTQTTIHFRHTPRALREGVFVSALAAATLVGGIITTSYRSKRRRKTNAPQPAADSERDPTPPARPADSLFDE